ncbi:hypothetical protein F503_06802 [Ophiostoma piceae UAMH 11346]|uniref:FMN-dependent dehydrogenase domain-containing protein n=1 Tax=Ophiostoma piceae (strain UAMH 11346) TaxID=1262450 RepID=S3CAS2_OPHP1|nr:hypothetical protein F503_06802 [Ophiostoma piceae UAMH 11346]
MGMFTYATTSMEEVNQQPSSDMISYGCHLSILKNKDICLDEIPRADATDSTSPENKLEIHKPLSLQNPKGADYTNEAAVARTRPARELYNPGRDASDKWDTATAWADQGDIKIAIDGGIRRGIDVFKALALGANFCFRGGIPI